MPVFFVVGHGDVGYFRLPYLTMPNPPPMYSARHLFTQLPNAELVGYSDADLGMSSCGNFGRL